MPFDGLRYPRVQPPHLLPAGEFELDRSHPLALGLIGYWPLAGDVRDYSFGGNYAVTSGAPPTGIGPQGPALIFNGSSQYVETTLSNLNYPSGTVSWWQTPTTAYNSGTIRAVWGQAGSTLATQEFSCQVFSDNNWYVGWNHSTDTRVVLAATASNWTQNVGSWYTFVWTPSGSTLYQNGVVIGTNASAPSVANLGTHLCFGRQGVSPNNYFTGPLGGFAIYNRALSAAEVRLHSAAPFAFLRPVARRTFVSYATGGTVYSASISEAMALAGTETVVAIFAVSDSEAMALSESETVTAIFRPSITEAATLADSPSVAAIFRPSITEAATLADQPSATFVTSASITETMTLADQPSATFVTASSITESMSLSDTVTGGLLLTASITEAASLSDSSSVTAAFAAAMSESMTLADSPAAVFIAAAAISEAMTLADSPSVAAILGVAISEAMALTDMSSAGGQIYTVSISEAMALADTISAAVAFAAAAAESLSLTDALSVAAVLSASLTEAMAFTDSATAGAVYPVSITDSISLQDVVSSPAAYIGGTVINILSGRVRVQMISGPTAVRMILARPRN